MQCRRYSIVTLQSIGGKVYLRKFVVLGAEKCMSYLFAALGALQNARMKMILNGSAVFQFSLLFFY